MTKPTLVCRLGMAVAAVAAVAAFMPRNVPAASAAAQPPETHYTSSVTTGGALEGSKDSRQFPPTKTSGLEITASGATIAFRKDVYLRITTEEKDTKITLTNYISPKEPKEKSRFQSSAGNLVFTVYNDSQGKDVLMKFRSGDITYAYDAPNANAPGTAVPSK